MKRVVYGIIPILGLLILLWNPGFPIRGEVNAFGIYTSRPETLQALDEPQSAFGQTFVGQAVVTQQTDIIPARKNIQFGYNYVLSGLQPNTDAEVKVVYRHPPLPGKDGAVVEHFEVGSRKRVRPDGTCVGDAAFYWVEASPLPEGKWTFEVWCSSRRVVSKTFTVTAAAQ